MAFLVSMLAGGQVSVLIVEDDRIVAENLKETIEYLGHKVIGVVDTGEKAIHEFKKQNADIVIMDVRLKGKMDGIETAILLHKDIKEVPIVFVTAHAASQFTHLNQIPASLYRYITKPYTEAQLKASLRDLRKGS